MRVRRGWAWPLVPLYAAGLAVKDGLRRVGVLRTRRLGWPVVSVGSLSAGGAGKTPVVIALAKLLHRRGWTVDVLSRGYGRSGHSMERVNPIGEVAAARFGDEPVQIARYTGVPVWVGPDRFAVGEAAERSSDTQMRCLHLLDDGFQHRQLARSLDIVLVTAEDLDDALLPAGNLREPMRALQRADVILLRERECELVRHKLDGIVRKDVVVWTMNRRLRLPSHDLKSRLLAFCAIARPQDFWQMLAEAGCSLSGKVAFRDHHAYRMEDIEGLVKTAEHCSATGFLITEKDHVKLSHRMMKLLLSIGPVGIVGLQVTFVDVGAVARHIESRIGEARIG